MRTWGSDPIISGEAQIVSEEAHLHAVDPALMNKLEGDMLARKRMHRN